MNYILTDPRESDDLKKKNKKKKINSVWPRSKGWGLFTLNMLTRKQRYNFFYTLLIIIHIITTTAVVAAAQAHVQLQNNIIIEYMWYPEEGRNEKSLKVFFFFFFWLIQNYVSAKIEILRNKIFSLLWINHLCICIYQPLLTGRMWHKVNFKWSVTCLS